MRCTSPQSQQATYKLVSLSTSHGAPGSSSSYTSLDSCNSAAGSSISVLGHGFFSGWLFLYSSPALFHIICSKVASAITYLLLRPVLYYLRYIALGARIRAQRVHPQHAETPFVQFYLRDECVCWYCEYNY